MISMLFALLMGLVLLTLVGAAYAGSRSIRAWFDRLALEREERRHELFVNKAQLLTGLARDLNKPIQSKEMPATEVVERNAGKAELVKAVEQAMRDLEMDFPEGWQE